MTLRIRLLCLIDRLRAIVLAALLVVPALGFGGAVWWARPVLAVLATLLVICWLLQSLLERAWRVLKSPLVPLGAVALGLACLQMVPLPGALAAKVSPRSQAVYALGDTPDREAPVDVAAEPAAVRSPITLDRSATLRWIAGAAVCLAVFWVVGQASDRIGQALVVWGAVVAVFLINTTLATVQVLGRSVGLYGFLRPGSGWAAIPSLADLAAAPGATAFRLVQDPGASASWPRWAVARPGPTPLIGSLMGGPGAYLALGALGLPLSLALVLQILAPRGSREGLATRLRDSGRGGLLVALGALTLASAVLVGLIAGPVLSVPFALGVLLVGLPGAWPSGLRWSAVAATAIVLLGLGVGVLAGLAPADRVDDGHPWAARADGEAVRRTWVDAARIVRDFPLLGTGAGSFAAVYPFYKTQDLAATTAQSSALQWLVEAGAAGMLLAGLGALWCLARLPGALARVGTADRALAFGLVGTAVCFATFSMLHWTVELPAVALAACAVGGTCDRWLAGATDLFIPKD